jgi:hypothetical protein
MHKRTLESAEKETQERCHCTCCCCLVFAHDDAIFLRFRASVQAQQQEVFFKDLELQQQKLLQQQRVGSNAQMKLVSLRSYEKQQQQQQQQQQRQQQLHTTQATPSSTFFPPLKKPPPLLSSVPFPPTPLEIAAWKKARQGLVSSSSSAPTAASASAVSPALPPRSKRASHAAAQRHDAAAVTDQHAHYSIVRGGLNALQRSSGRSKSKSSSSISSSRVKGKSMDWLSRIEIEGDGSGVDALQRTLLNESAVVVQLKVILVVT